MNTRAMILNRYAEIRFLPSAAQYSTLRMRTVLYRFHVEKNWSSLFNREKTQPGESKREGTWIADRERAVSDNHRLRERMRRTDLGFASPFLPVEVIDSLAGALELTLASAVCFTGRGNGDPPGYQTVYMARHLSSLSGVLTCSSFCQSLVTTASTSAPCTFVTTLSPTLNGLLTNPEFEDP